MIDALSRSGLRMTGGLLVVLGIVTGGSTRLLLGPPVPTIRVAWQNDSVGARRYLEKHFSLTDPQREAGGMWSYALRDASTANVRALTGHRDVRTVEGVDVAAGTVSTAAPSAACREGWLRASELIATALETVAWSMAVIGAALLLFPSATLAIVIWLQRGVPAVGPEAAAAFRVVFGTLVVLFVASEPVEPQMLSAFALEQASGPYGSLVRWLGAHPQMVVALHPVLIVTGVLFVIGAATRVTFTCFTAAALVWGSVFTLNISAHAIAALELALLALLAAPWGQAWSVDAWIRRRRGRTAPASASRAYGYAFWAPGFVLAVTFAAAAWSKVREGPGWVLNGTVKYHFVSDLEHAWVTWGPWLTHWQVVAVGLAAGAVIIEAALITAMFARRYAYRAALGGAAAVLLLGFAMFQGIVWLAWWLLLLAFLPWHLVGRRDVVSASTTVRGASAAQIAAMLLVIGQQLVVTARHIEARPMFSKYDMYSSTYATPEAYEAASNLVYRVVAVSDGRSADLPGCVVDDRVAEIARGAAASKADDLELLRHAIGGCLRNRADVQAVALEGDRQVFLWNESRFAWKRRLDVIGPIDASRLRP